MIHDGYAETDLGFILFLFLFGTLDVVESSDSFSRAAAANHRKPANSSMEFRALADLFLSWVHFRTDGDRLLSARPRTICHANTLLLRQFGHWADRHRQWKPCGNGGSNVRPPSRRTSMRSSRGGSPNRRDRSRWALQFRIPVIWGRERAFFQSHLPQSDYPSSTYFSWDSSGSQWAKQSRQSSTQQWRTAVNWLYDASPRSFYLQDSILFT